MNEKTARKIVSSGKLDKEMSEAGALIRKECVKIWQSLDLDTIASESSKLKCAAGLGEKLGALGQRIEALGMGTQEQYGMFLLMHGMSCLVATRSKKGQLPEVKDAMENLEFQAFIAD